MGSLVGLSVDLIGFSHTFARDVDVLLVSPTGQTMLIMSDAGGPGVASNVNLTIIDTASGVMPGTTLSSGSYLPTDRTDNSVCQESLPSPAPASGSSPGPCGTATLLSTFGGINPNGTWQLFVTDDSAGDSGSFSGGWSLTITTNDVSTATPEPNTVLLTGFGVAAAWAIRRRRN